MKDIAGIEHLFIKGTNATVETFTKIFVDKSYETFEDDRLGMIYRKGPHYMPLVYMGRVGGVRKRQESGMNMLSIQFKYDRVFNSCGIAYRFSTGEIGSLGNFPACTHHIMLRKSPETYNKIYSPETARQFLDEILDLDNTCMHDQRRQKNRGKYSKDLGKLCEKAISFMGINNKSHIV